MCDQKFYGVHKYFDQNLFDKYDIPARKKVMELLGDLLTENPQVYEQDFIINNGTKYKYLELQVCSTWEKEEYPHKNIFIYERKAKYNEDTLFLVLNYNYTVGYFFNIKDIKKTKPKRLRKYSREFVYNISWNNAVRVNMNENNRINIISILHEK